METLYRVSLGQEMEIAEKVMSEKASGRGWIMGNILHQWVGQWMIFWSGLKSLFLTQLW
jgi:hypothetical protein